MLPEMIAFAVPRSETCSCKPNCCYMSRPLNNNLGRSWQLQKLCQQYYICVLLSYDFLVSHVYLSVVALSSLSRPMSLLCLSKHHPNRSPYTCKKNYIGCPLLPSGCASLCLPLSVDFSSFSPSALCSGSKFSATLLFVKGDCFSVLFALAPISLDRSQNQPSMHGLFAHLCHCSCDGNALSGLI